MEKQSSSQGGARKRSRVEISLDVHLACPQTTVTVQSENISLKGILCAANPGLEIGLVCDVVILLSEEAQIRVQSQVVRSDADKLALDFLKMDEQSFQHLYNLVKMNASDPDSIETELHVPAFAPPFEIYEHTKKK